MQYIPHPAKDRVHNFSSGPCKGSEYFVQIVEKMSGNGRIGKEVDPQITKERRKREDQWMLKLRTWAHGLNDALNEIVDATGVVGRPFPSLPRSHSGPCIGSVSKNTGLMDHDIFFNKFRHLLDNQLRYVAHFLRVSLFSMRKYDIKLIDRHPSLFP